MALVAAASESAAGSPLGTPRASVWAHAQPVAGWDQLDQDRSSGAANQSGKQHVAQQSAGAIPEVKKKSHKKKPAAPILQGDAGTFVLVQGADATQFLALVVAPVDLQALMGAVDATCETASSATVDVAWCYQQKDLAAKHAALFKGPRLGRLAFVLSNHVEPIAVSDIIAPVAVNMPLGLQVQAGQPSLKLSTLFLLPYFFLLDENRTCAWRTAKLAEVMATRALAPGLGAWLRLVSEAELPRAPRVEGASAFWPETRAVRGEPSGASCPGTDAASCGLAGGLAGGPAAPAALASVHGAPPAPSVRSADSPARPSTPCVPSSIVGVTASAQATAAPVRDALRAKMRESALRAAADERAGVAPTFVPSYFRDGDAVSGDATAAARRVDDDGMVHATEVTDEDAALVAERMGVYRQQLADLAQVRERKKITLVREVHPFLTEQEVEAAFAETERADPDELIARFSTDREFLLLVREQVAVRRTSASRRKARQIAERSVGSGGARGARSGSRSHRSTLHRGQSTGVERSELIQSVMSALEGDGVPREHSAAQHAGNLANAAPSRLRETVVVVNKEAEQELVPQLVVNEHAIRLGAAVPAPEDKGALLQLMEGWSDARVKAYRHIDTNPNAYYYRFNDPGEATRKGSFTTDEHEMFMRRLAEIGPGRWGIFSMTMPGRVGYQCSGHYRRMIEAGIIQDANYALDETGRARYLEDDGKYRCHPRHGDAASGSAGADPVGSQPADGSVPGTPKVARKRKRSESAAASTDGGGRMGSDVVPPLSASSSAAPEPSVAGSTTGAGPKSRKKRKLFDEPRAAGTDGVATSTATPGAPTGASAVSTGATAGDAMRAARRPSRIAAAPLGSAPASKKRTAAKRKPTVTRDEREMAALIQDMQSEWRPTATFYSTKRLRGITGTASEYVNPLSGYRDPITYEPVEAPAMSKYGHVCGHTTWRMTLEAKEVCPFTGQPLTLRDITTLTAENIDELRPKMVLL